MSALTWNPIVASNQFGIVVDSYHETTNRRLRTSSVHWSKIIFAGRGQTPKEAASAEEVKKRVAASPTAIGYIDATLVDDTVRVVF